jgi:hypothetical protein
VLRGGQAMITQREVGESIAVGFRLRAQGAKTLTALRRDVNPIASGFAR